MVIFNMLVLSFTQCVLLWVPLGAKLDIAFPTLQALGGAKYMVLSHKDDVADHAKWAKALGAERIIHLEEITRSQGTTYVFQAPWKHACKLHGQLGSHFFPRDSSNHTRPALLWQCSVAAHLRSLKRGMRISDLLYVPAGNARSSSRGRDLGRCLMRVTMLR